MGAMPAATKPGERYETRAPSRRVLLVEDDPDALETLRSWAETQDCEIRTARSGEAALQIGASFEPHVLITDYLLRDELTGVDVIAELRRRGVKVSCVLVTAVMHKALLESLHRIDGVPILAKPFDFGRLAELVTRGGR